MADIKKTFFMRHLRASPTTHIRHLKNGTVEHDGVGEAFWFRSLTAAISEIPVDNREQPLLFHARTSDFQDVTVQATITYRVADPALAATRIDFGIDPDSGAWRARPLEQVGGLLTELAQQYALDLLARIPLPQALSEGMAAVRDRLTGGLTEDERLAGIGLAIIDVRVVAVRAEPDVERALQTPTREAVQQDADKATYGRRAPGRRTRTGDRGERVAEPDRAGQARGAAGGAAGSQRPGPRHRGGRRGTHQRGGAGGDAAHPVRRAGRRTRAVGLAEADAEAARVATYRELEAATILGLAVKELAGNLPQIGTLNLTPDVLTGLLARLSGGETPAPPA